MKKENIVYRINGEDGPTSVFILKNIKKRTLKQQLQKSAYNRKKKRIEKTITGESHHSMEDVLAFAVNECGLTELDRDSDEVREEYKQLRASFMLQYKPELLGEYAKLPPLEREDPEAVKEHLEKCKKQFQYAVAVPKELFDIDVHKYIKKYSDINESLDVVIETKYGYIGGGAAGKKAVKDLNEMMIRLHKYYGVTQEDIDRQTERYKNLIRTLCN
ncbi:MAG: hypothetical protein OSJ72_07935 [Lachnospiraceae bacterium]|nr:hypothetical protein [Lachnospiraceae bacterium]